MTTPTMLSPPFPESEPRGQQEPQNQQPRRRFPIKSALAVALILTHEGLAYMLDRAEFVAALLSPHAGVEGILITAAVFYALRFAVLFYLPGALLAEGLRVLVATRLKQNVSARQTD